MVAHGYLGYLEHKVHHDWLVGEVARLEARLQRGELEPAAVAALMANWVHHHIAEVDSGYIAFFAKAGLAADRTTR